MKDGSSVKKRVEMEVKKQASAVKAASKMQQSSSREQWMLPQRMVNNMATKSDAKVLSE